MLRAKPASRELLTKTEKGYWFDLDAIRFPHITKPPKAVSKVRLWDGSYGGSHDGITKLKRTARVGHLLGKNPGDVWRLAKAAHKGGAFGNLPRKAD